MRLRIGNPSTYLDTVVSISKIVQRLKLFVDDPNAGLVRSDDDALDVTGRFILYFQLIVDVFCSFNSRLRVKFG